MPSLWISCPEFTVLVETDESGVIRKAAPIVRRFIGQPLANLQRWKRCDTVRLPDLPPCDTIAGGPL